MQVKIKKLQEDAVIPSYATAGDAGMDLVAVNALIAENGEYVEYGTGLSIEIPEGYVGLLFPRSSISNTSLTLANSVGVIDSGYRGEIRLRFKDSQLAKVDEKWFAGYTSYELFNKVGQLIILPYPQIEFVETEELVESERGEEGFGSTGK